MDGEVLTEKLEGTALSLDPGPHNLTFEAPGQPTVTKQIVVREGEKDRREMVQVGTSGALRRRHSQEPRRGPGDPQGVLPDSAHTGPSGRRTGAYVAGGVGVAGLLVGAIGGGAMLAQKSTMSANCPMSSMASTSATAMA